MPLGVRKNDEVVVLAGRDYREIPPTQDAVNALVHELIADHILS